jgi:hypothetical protein
MVVIPRWFKRIRYTGIERTWRSVKSTAFGSPVPGWAAPPRIRSATVQSKRWITGSESSSKAAMAWPNAASGSI